MSPLSLKTKRRKWLKPQPQKKMSLTDDLNSKTLIFPHADNGNFLSVSFYLTWKQADETFRDLCQIKDCKIVCDCCNINTRTWSTYQQYFSPPGMWHWNRTTIGALKKKKEETKLLHLNYSCINTKTHKFILRNTSHRNSFSLSV